MICDHCGLGLPATPIYGPQGQGRFCCNGCATVSAVLNTLRLGRYYSIRKNAGESGRPAQVIEQSYLHWDHPLTTQESVQVTNPNHYQVSLSIEGVHCSACVWVLEKLPDILPGVLSSRVDFGRSEILLDFDPQKILLSTIAQQLNQLGYPPRLINQENLLLQKKFEESESRSQLVKIGIAGFCAGNLMMIAVSLYEGMFSGIAKNYENFFNWFSVGLSLPAVFYSAIPFYQRALNGLRMKTIHIDLPISIAILAGFFVSLWNVLQGHSAIYFDSLAALIFLLLVGRWIQWSALQRVRRMIDKSQSLIPDWAFLSNGSQVPIKSLKEGDLIQVASQGRIPVDGIVMVGESNVDRSILTGETKLFPVEKGSEVLAGCLNLGAPLILRVGRVGPMTQMGRIDQLVKQASLGRTPLLEWVDRLSRIFLFSILILAGLTLVYWGPRTTWPEALDRVLALLVVSCPCALGLATPLAMSLAVGTAAKNGLLLRSVDVLERLLNIQNIFFDKTGTLTTGRMSVASSRWYTEDPNIETENLQILFGIESKVEHPIARSICDWIQKQPQYSEIPFEGEFHPVLGKGLQGTSLGSQWTIGSRPWFEELGITFPEFTEENRTIIGCARDGKLFLVLELYDPLRSEANEVVGELSKQIKNIHILSGDRKEVVSDLGKKLGLKPKNLHGGLNPQEKWEILKEFRNTMMVGDGVNDAAALAASDVGVAIRSGSEIVLQSAPICLAQNDLRLVSRAFDLARRTRKVILRNLGFSLAYNITGSFFAITGVINPLWAAIIMPLSSLTVVGSTLLSRVFRRNQWS